MDSRQQPPPSVARFLAKAKMVATIVGTLGMVRRDLDCPSCGAAMVVRQIAEFRCDGCQATWIYLSKMPRPTPRERRRIEATRMPEWWRTDPEDHDVPSETAARRG